MVGMLLKLLTTTGIAAFPASCPAKKGRKGRKGSAAAAAGSAVSPLQALREGVQRLVALSPRIQRSLDKIKVLVGCER